MVNTVILGDCLYKKKQHHFDAAKLLLFRHIRKYLKLAFYGACGNKVFLSRDALALNSD